MTFEYNAYSRGRVIKRMEDRGFSREEIAKEFGMPMKQVNHILNAKFYEAREEKRKRAARAELEAVLERGDLRYLLPILPQLKELIK